MDAKLRRSVVGLLTLLHVICFAYSTSIPSHRYQLDPFPFEYGIASGDPIQDAVLLWTRANNQSQVVWSVWVPGTGSFEENVTSGVATTDEAIDFVVHIDVTGLQPKTRYEYAFEAAGVRSRIGRTKTAPAVDDPNVGEVKLATFSCACHWCGFLNGYREIAENPDIDIVLGLGDWLYPPPYLSNLYGGTCPRVPAGMCYTGAECDNYLEVDDIPAQTDCDPSNVHRLQDMRHYHKILNTDVDVRALRAAHPLILLPDNHDINDDITTNLSSSVEIQAWLEWVPTRYSLSPDGSLFLPRQYIYGSLLDIVRMDTRNIGRNEDPPSYLGADQEVFFEDVVFGANKTDGWRVLLTSQVFMPWTIREEGYVPLVYGIVMIFNGPLMLGLFICTGIRYRRHKSASKEAESKVQHYSQNLSKEATEGDSSRLKRIRTKTSRCCLSYPCIGFTFLLIIFLFVGAAAGIDFAKAYMDDRGISANAAGVPNIQSGRSRAWDGDDNSIHRAAFLAQMKRLNAFNNIFITGDMHISLAADVADTAVGIGPPATIPSETTRFGVEFLSSSVSKSNVDERAAREVGYALVPAVKWLFEAAMTGSNPHFRYFESQEHGYGLVTITPARAEFVWRHQRYDVIENSVVARQLSVDKDKNRFN